MRAHDARDTFTWSHSDTHEMQNEYTKIDEIQCECPTYQKFQVALGKKIWRLIGFACIKDSQITGTNDFGLLFFKNLLEQFDCVCDYSLSCLLSAWDPQ